MQFRTKLLSITRISNYSSNSSYRLINQSINQSISHLFAR